MQKGTKEAVPELCGRAYKAAPQRLPVLSVSMQVIAHKLGLVFLICVL